MKLAEVFPQEQTIELADKQKYTFTELHLNAQAAIMDVYGVDLLGSEKDDRSGLQVFLQDILSSDAKAWRFLVYQLLKKHHKNLTEEDVGYLLTPMNQPLVYKTCIQQIFNSFPVSNESKNEMALQLDELLKSTTGSLQ